MRLESMIEAAAAKDTKQANRARHEKRKMKEQQVAEVERLSREKTEDEVSPV